MIASQEQEQKEDDGEFGLADDINDSPLKEDATAQRQDFGSSSDPMAVPPEPVEEKKESFMQAASSKALRPFVIISSSYLLFTITDGAIRMIVLLHAYNENFSALEVSIMFTLYELAGVFTNLAAGVMGARWGIKFTLVSGLMLQLIAFGLLFAWNDEWNKQQAIIYVTFAQMFAGIAKDLTKLGGKTVTKLVTPDEQDTKLFKLVSLITGWKNSLKGVGYFLGSALLQVSYEVALASMMGLVLLAMPWAIFGLDRNLGTAKKKNASWSEIFVFDNRNLNWLSFARLFLFASRDFWFEVPLPFFLRSPSCEGLGTDVCIVDEDCTRSAICGADNICANINSGGGCGGLGVERVIVGAFLGGYIILYGQVQSWTPQLVTGPLDQTPPNKLTEILWGYINCLPTLVAWLVVSWGPTFRDYNLNAMTVWIIVIVVTFAVIFAINSSIHSYLVVNYASKEKLAVSVGLYYMSNAVGRLFGTLGSGILYTYVGEDFGDAAGSDAVAGLAACFLAGTICSFMAASLTFPIKDNKSGLKCGPCCTIVAAEDGPGDIEPENFPVEVDTAACKHCHESPCVWKSNEATVVKENDKVFSVGEGKMNKQSNRRYFAKRQMATILGLDPASIGKEEKLPYCCHEGILKHWPN
ncbi:major facilitator superfamily permease [Nitzschia inconspicua]|uniref:Major facilitator superfamily permease n=1 Tax=Nitzschia inconspicua TaxID=303405 RepID=A0A9K3PIV6_9STRA|nr:major facilitator superfamily permease [Nitzschia inconspicua]